MIKGLRECPLTHAISPNPEIHSGWIGEFLTNAMAIKDDNVITSQVAEKKLRVKAEDVRRALNIKGAPNHFFDRIKKTYNFCG